MTDLGQQMIDRVYEKQQIDEQWSTRAQRSFSWIGHRLEQTVSTTREIQDGEFSLFKLSAVTTVVDEVQAPEESVNRVLSDLNRFAFGSCYSFVPGERRIYANTSSWVHRDTANWRGDIFDVYAIGQLCFAEADYLADRCKGTVAVRPHSRSGLRKRPDDMLNVTDDVFAPKGLGPSRYGNAFEFEAVADAARRSPNVATMGGAADGIALECSFDNYTAISIINPEEKHRRLGAGLSIRLHLPTTITHDDGFRIAAALNRHERDDGPLTGHMGAWCVDMRTDTGLTVTYRSFLPNWIYRSGLIMDSAMGCIRRMNWADQKINSKPTTESAWKRLAKRFGVAGPGE